MHLLYEKMMHLNLHVTDGPLDIIAARCGYDLKNHHHALADAEACAWIAREIL